MKLAMNVSTHLYELNHVMSYLQPNVTSRCKGSGQAYSDRAVDWLYIGFLYKNFLYLQRVSDVIWLQPSMLLAWAD